MMKDYYLGLDIGTDSVGIACTDEQYKLLRLNRKDAWAVRLFDSANTAADRRIKRTMRRRLNRRKFRIKLLQEIFAPYMDDDTFFIRLNNSAYAESDKDKRLVTKFAVFPDETAEKQFHKDFPTIYHLRKALADGKQDFDMRLWYLALHHLIKYRGNFLREGQSFDVGGAIRELLTNVNAAMDDVFPDDNWHFDVGCADKFVEEITKLRGKNDRKRKAEEIFAPSTKQQKAAVAAAVGCTIALKDLFDDENVESKADFSELTDDKLAELSAELSDEYYSLVAALKDVGDFLAMKKILGDDKTVSEAMIRIYEQHRADLKQLRNFVKTHCNKEIYNRIFRDSGEPYNYAHYVGFTKPQQKKIKLKVAKDEEFLKYLKKVLQDNAENCDELKEIIDKIDNKDFLPKILHADNGRFPYQLNLIEVEKILENLEKFHPMFAKPDEDGKSPSEKIKMLLTFRIPYYVGPLKDGWAVRKEGRITPWNFDEKVDKHASAEGFIRRMTNKCVYLPTEDVLPKNSILYCRFNTLNIINKLKINETPIGVELKKELFEQLYCRTKQVTDAKIKDYLVRTGRISKAEVKDTTISGKSENENPSMAPYIKMKEIMGSLVDERPAVAEQIILWHTLHTDKSVVKKQIKDNYGDVFTDEQINRLATLQYKDFGKLSKKFLAELSGGTDPTSGEMLTVIDLLYNTNENLNQILNNPAYNFQQALSEARQGKEEITLDDVNQLYVSPQLRRSVWQTLRMIDEYVNAVGCAPKKIFIEVTRQEDLTKKGKKTESRKEMLQGLYKNLEDCSDIARDIEAVDNLKLRSERLYLYFRQKGKCMYSGDMIDLGNLDSDMYDVDHIVPQSKYKDDSLDNKVLVKKALNLEKSDTYPLPEKFRKQESLWKDLHSCKLISDKKYKLLTRTTPLTDDELQEFTNMQLTVTSQAAIAVADLLKEKYPESKIVYSKAKQVSDFRHKFNILKCRDVNDLHHAKDAYLNIVVGNVMSVRFTDKFYLGEKYKNNDLSPDNVYSVDIEGAWVRKNNETINVVKSVCAKNSPVVTRAAFTNNGAFYDETVYNKNTKVSEPRKSTGPLSDVTKYGGYDSSKTAYFAIVRSEGKKGSVKTTIEAIPVLTYYRSKTDENAIMNYLKNIGLVNPQIVVDKLGVKSLLKVDGMPVYIAGVTGERIKCHNAVEWFVSQKTSNYVKSLGKFADIDKNSKIEDRDSYKMHVSGTRQQTLLEINAENNLALYNEILSQLQKPVYSISGIQAFAETLKNRRDAFTLLTVKQQVTVLLQCVNVLQCNAKNADLSLLGEGKGCGELKFGKDVSKRHVEIIHRSPGGLEEHVVSVN